MVALIPLSYPLLMPLMLALGKQRLVDLCEFQTSLVYTSGSGTTRTTEGDLILIK